MAFRGTTSQIQGIVNEPSQSASLHRPSHGLTSIPTLFNIENHSFVLVVPPLTHTRRCFAINTNHVYQIVAFTSRGFEGLEDGIIKRKAFALIKDRALIEVLAFAILQIEKSDRFCVSFPSDTT